MSSPKNLLAGVVGLGVALTGLTAVTPSPAQAADPATIQLLATNDFHGRIQRNGSQAGAAILSGAVNELRGQNPNTVFAAAGDLIGASTFESFIQDDKPTIDALNAAGLEVSAVGNHEFDQGYADLVDRVMAPYDAETNPFGGAAWEYLAANVEEPEGRDDIAETWTVEFGGVQVGFVGAVTEELPSLVSPSGIEGLTVTDIVEATNTQADALVAQGADVVVLLVHEGAPSTDCATMDDSGAFADIVNGVNDNVNAIVSGHTHLAYDCEFDGMPVVSAGQYGMALNQLNFSVDPDSGDVLGVETALLNLMGPDPDGSGPDVPPALYPSDPAVEPIVADAVAKAEVLGAEPLGQVSAPFKRALLMDPDAEGGPAPVENRGGESTLSNLVAEVHRWATSTPEAGAAQIAFMNPGGLRADMSGPTVTYKQAAVVQPFANTLMNMDMTGEQIETLLEQQWQRNSEGAVPSRPFLRLGVSDGFTYTYQEYPDPAIEGARLGEVTGMWLNGEPIDPAATYSVTANSFLAAGGDNFREFRNASGKTDTGKVDLSAMVDYLAQFASESPLAPDYAQRAVEVVFPENAPAVYRAGDHVQFGLESLAMTADLETEGGTDSAVSVFLGDQELGSAPVENAMLEVPFDDAGTASVDVTLPANTPAGPATLRVVGDTTGTEVLVPIAVERHTAKIRLGLDPAPLRVGKPRSTLQIDVNAGDVVPTGTVKVRVEGFGLVGERTLADGAATVRLPRFGEAGRVEITVRYLGDDQVAPAAKTITRRVRR